NCDDGDLCNGVRKCDAQGVCQQPVNIPDCDDGDLCTVDSCTAGTGACVHTATAGCCTTNAQCDDGNACTVDTCNADHACDHTPKVCNDSNPCTTDSCNVQTGCVATPIASCQQCNDASTCGDDADVCTDKACVGGRCEQVPNPNCCNVP